jgi:hypothetical protein
LAHPARKVRSVRIPTHRDHPFRLIVTADSGGT